MFVNRLGGELRLNPSVCNRGVRRSGIFQMFRYAEVRPVRSRLVGHEGFLTKALALPFHRGLAKKSIMEMRPVNSADVALSKGRNCRRG